MAPDNGVDKCEARDGPRENVQRRELPIGKYESSTVAEGNE